MAHYACIVASFVSELVARYGGVVLRTVSVLDSEPEYERLRSAIFIMGLQSDHLRSLVFGSIGEKVIRSRTTNSNIPLN